MGRTKRQKAPTSSTKENALQTPVQRKSKRISNSKRTPLSTIQPNSVTLTASKKKERSSSPALPEIPVIINEDGVLEIEKKEPGVCCGTQTDTVTKVDKCVETPIDMSLDYLMVTEDQPPVEYWMVLAEKRRLALIDSTKEKDDLYQEIDRLKKALEDLERHKQEAQYFAFLYKLSTDY